MDIVGARIIMVLLTNTAVVAFGTVAIIDTDRYNVRGVKGKE